MELTTQIEILNKCCILAFDRGKCSSSENNVIAGCPCINKQKHATWVTTIICGHCEIVYTQSTVDTGSLAGVSLQSGVLGLDTVSHGEWPPGRPWR